MATFMENNSDQMDSQKWQIDQHRLVTYRNCKYFTLICFIVFVICNVLIQIDLINVNQYAQRSINQRNINKHEYIVEQRQIRKDGVYLNLHRIKLRKLQMEEEKQPYQSSTQTEQNAYLKVQQPATPAPTSQSPTHTKVYVILLIVGLCLLLTGGLIILGVVVYRHFINPQQAPLIIRSNQVANGSKMQLNTSMIAPPISHSIFIKEIGEPLHDSCVICLESFGNSAQLSNINENESMGIQQIYKNKNKQSNKSDKQIVSLTICGHLLHQKCLKQWISRQANCPLCREQFSDQNLTQWQTKIGIDFSYIYDIFQKQAKDTKKQSMTSPKRFRNSNRITNINTICKYENKKVSRNRDIDTASNYSNTRDSIQLHWLRIYNNRKVINKQRHNKYNIYTVLKRIDSNRIPHNNNNNNRKLTKITNQNTNDMRYNYDIGNKEQSRCSMMGGGNKLRIGKKQKEIQYRYQQFSNKELYALMVYSAIMDYHQARHGQANDNDAKQEVQANVEEVNNKNDNRQQKAAANSSDSEQQQYQIEQINAKASNAIHNKPKDKKEYQGQIILQQSSQAYIQSQSHVRPNRKSMHNNHNNQSTTSNKENINKENININSNTNTRMSQNKVSLLQVKQQTKLKPSRVSTPFSQQLQNLQSIIYPTVSVGNQSPAMDSQF